MTWELRVLLLIFAVGTAAIIISSIRRNSMQIGHSIYWLCFSGILIVLALFPQLAIWVSGLLGFESPANFVYLAFIFMLIVKVFSLTVKISAMDAKITSLTQDIALRETKAPAPDTEAEPR